MAGGDLSGTLVVVAAKIPACVNCWGSGVVHFFVKESSGCAAAVTACAAFAARRVSPPSCFKRAAMGGTCAACECPSQQASVCCPIFAKRHL